MIIFRFYKSDLLKLTKKRATDGPEMDEKRGGDEQT
jgi:hypothetical protein